MLYRIRILQFIVQDCKSLCTHFIYFVLFFELYTLLPFLWPKKNILVTNKRNEMKVNGRLIQPTLHENNIVDEIIVRETNTACRRSYQYWRRNRI